MIIVMLSDVEADGNLALLDDVARQSDILEPRHFRHDVRKALLRAEVRKRDRMLARVAAHEVHERMGTIGPSDLILDRAAHAQDAKVEILAFLCVLDISDEVTESALAGDEAAVHSPSGIEREARL